MSELVDILSESLKNEQTGSDYTATVTRIDGQTAYVKISGSDIADTPVALTIGANVGDTVRVRVADGRAWITGNDTEPPAGPTEVVKIVENSKFSNRIKENMDGIQIEVKGKMQSDMSNRASTININSGQIAFSSNSLVVDSDNFKLDENGNAEFSGTVKGATYKDGSHNFTMEIGTSESSGGSVSPAFKIGGYLNGDSSNEYLEIVITISPVITTLPHLSIAGRVRSSATSSDDHEVSMTITESGINFAGEWPGAGHTVSSNIPWGYNP